VSEYEINDASPVGHAADQPVSTPAAVEAASDVAVDSGAPVTEGGDLLVLDSWQVSLPATGDTRVDAALSRLSDVDGLPPSEHADLYEAVHADLHAALADLDQA
jgi:hypothetical protein